MKKRMIKLMTIFCMAGILTINPVIIGLAEGTDAVGAEVPEEAEKESEKKPAGEEPEPADKEAVNEELAAENVEESEEADTETGEEETEPAVEAEETLEETEAEEAFETATMSANEAAVPVVMAADDQDGSDTDIVVGYVKEVHKNYNNNKTGSVTESENTTYKENVTITLSKPENDREGYDFIGWYKDGNLISGNSYTITADDVKNGKITFTAGWRQKVTITVDGTVTSLETEEGATAKSVSYDLSKVGLSKPDDSYEFAKKWVINDNVTPCNATDTMTVTFEQTDGNLVFDAKSVSVDGTTDVSITDKDIKLASCWNSVEGHYNLLIKNGTTGTLTANENKAGDAGTIDLKNVSADSKITFKVNGWTLEKPVSDLINAEPEYIEKNGKYYQYRESTITDADFKKTISITYQDTDSSTVFYVPGDNQKEVEYKGSYTKEIDIYAGNEPTWKELLSGSVRTERSDETGNYILGNTWKYRLGDKDADITKNVNFYDNDVHSLTAQPVWLGTCTYKKNYPTSQGGITEPETKSAEVGTPVTLPTLGNMEGKYTFEGWLDSDGKTYEGGATYTIEKANMIFTAQWKAVPYKLKFMDEDGIVYCEGEADFNTPITWPSKPTKEGYTFQNWVVEIDKEKMPVKHGTNFTMYDQDMTFTAQWSINSYKISYDGNGAAMGVPAESVEQNYQTDYTIDTVIPTKTGYTFQGWNDGTTTYQPGATFKVPAKDVVLTAQWKINSHQVKYDGNGGKTSAPESKNADYNSNVSVAAGLEKDGYLFEGWEQISTGKVLAPGASFVMPDMDETLKAKWKIAYSSINGKGTYYLVSGQSYTLASGLKVQGDNSSYSGNMTFYVPQSGYYTFE